MKPRLVFGLKPRGAHSLKGVPSEWRLVEAEFVPKFVTDSGVLLIIPAHCSARRHRDLVLPQQ
ncbi:MAG TPA: hypothetical protein VK567_22975, partial [Bradyrhizobium sp.]|nr:hypothetical protein [Bradyrhizobium sp.]